MAKKISNFVYGLIFGLFVLVSLGTFIFNADSLYTNDDGVGEILVDVGETGQNDYLSTESTVYDSTFETGTFSLPEGQDVETRGTTQGVILAKNNPSTATNAINQVFAYITVHPLVTGLIISLIIFTSSLLVLRLFLGETRT